MQEIDILFAWELGAGLGHIGRLRPLAEAFRRRGRTVAFAVRDGRHCPTVFAGTDIPWYPAPVKLIGDNAIALPRTYTDILSNVGFGDLSELRSRVSAWRNLIASLNPKLVVLEHSPTALLALQGLPCRKAVVGIGFFVPPDAVRQPDLRPRLPRSADTESVERRVLENINAVLRDQGEPVLERAAQLYSRCDETALVTFPELDHFGPRQNVRYWGTWDSDWGDASPWRNSAAKKVFLYLKPSSILEPLARELPSSAVECKFYVPELPPESVRAWAGDSAEVLDRPANLRELFTSCDLVVTHGTHGVASEALLAGKPLVNFPITLEQTLLSQRIEKLGAGRSGNFADPVNATSRVRSALESPSLSAAAAAFAARYATLRPADQADRLATRLLALLENDPSAAGR